MKKILLFSLFIVFCASPSFAICSYLNLCPTTDSKLSSKMGQLISRKTGATLLSEKVAQARILDELRRMTDQKFDVAVESFSIQDLLHGRVKSITISGNNLNFNGVYLTYLELKTICDYNYVQIDRDPIRFKENMIIKFSTVISDKDLKKTMDSSGYLNKLNCVNIQGCGITFFKLSGAGVNIKDNKLNFRVKVTSDLLLEKPLDIALSSKLKVENGRIVLTKVNFGNMQNKVDLSKVGYRLDAMNPLTFSLNVLENKNTKMCIRGVEINGDNVTVNGNIFIPKNITIGQ